MKKPSLVVILGLLAILCVIVTGWLAVRDMLAGASQPTLEPKK